METVDLNDLPIYNRLSYTWGDPGPPSGRPRAESVDYSVNNKWPISCNNKLLFVTQNLYDALRKLQQSHSIIAEQPDSRRQTRLHWAAASGDQDVVKHLHNGADITSQDVDWKTPLDVAVTRKHHHLVSTMVLAESDRNTVHASDSIPRSSEQLHYRRLLKSVNNHIQYLKLTKKLPECSNRPGVDRNFIWIDALCINQEDGDERNAQVNLMGLIYRSAETVVVWLGPKNEHSKTAVEVISELANDRMEEKCEFFFGNSGHSVDLDNHQALLMLGVFDIPNASWNSLAVFYQYNWFYRAWIIQEMVLAKKILIFCGHVQMPWDELYRASAFLMLSSWSVELGRWAGASNPLAVGPVAWMRSKSGIDSELHTQVNLLWRQLIQVRLTNATDPRDKIFSILGFTCPPVHTKDPAATLIADYRKPVELVYTEAARATLLDSVNLDSLCLIEEKSTRGKLQVCRLGYQTIILVVVGRYYLLHLGAATIKITLATTVLLALFCIS